MEIETMGLGAGSYPEPPENEQYVDITINITYSMEQVPFPKDWDKEQILECIRDNLSDYTNREDMEDYEIEV